MDQLLSLAHLAGLMFAAPVPRPFRPPFKLAGRPVVVGRAQLAFRAPTGWTHDWADDGSEYRIAQRFDRAAAIRRCALGAARPIAELLRDGLAAIAAGLIPLSEPRELTVNDLPAGRLIGRTTIDGVEVEGYLGAVVVGTEVIEVSALYEVESAAVMRAGLDTILATLDAD